MISVLAAVLVLAGLGTGAWAYGRSLNGNLARTNAFAGLNPNARPKQVVTGAMNVLVLGKITQAPGPTDTMMLVHLDANHQHAYVISIPRDTWVYVPASPNGQYGNTMAKINAAYSWGGIPLTVQTVEKFTGVRIDHVVTVDFTGFRQVVDALGGVDMNIPKTFTSVHAPYRVFPQGVQHLDGTWALDYLRQRMQFGQGDLTRALHARQFLTALLNKAASGGTLTNPAKLNAFLQAVTKSVTVDNGFDLVGVMLQLSNLRSNNITMLASPTAGFGTSADGQSIVLADSAKAKALYQAVANDTMASYLATTQATPSPSTSPAAG